MTSRPDHAVLFTCEHGGNRIPRKYAHRFAEHAELLQTHRGWDPGTLAVARHFAQQITSQFFSSETSRLLIDLNRSETNPSLFSKLVPPPGEAERIEILETYYRPWRHAALDWVAGQAKCQAFVWHVSFHSFTPVFNGQIRTAEIGLLYDPSRKPERSFCHAWAARLHEALPGHRIRMNYPYRGTADGHTAALRKQFSAKQYAGIELEVNQQLFQQPARKVKRLIAGLCLSWQQAFEETVSSVSSRKLGSLGC